MMKFLVGIFCLGSVLYCVSPAYSQTAKKTVPLTTAIPKLPAEPKTGNVIKSPLSGQSTLTSFSTIPWVVKPKNTAPSVKASSIKMELQAPTLVSVTPTQETATVVFTDLSDNESRFVVERAETACDQNPQSWGSVRPYNSSNMEGTGDTITYSFPAFQLPNQSVCYRVKAAGIDPVTGNWVYSAPSNSLTVTFGATMNVVSSVPAGSQDSALLAEATSQGPQTAAPSPSGPPTGTIHVVTLDPNRKILHCQGPAASEAWTSNPGAYACHHIPMYSDTPPRLLFQSPERGAPEGSGGLLHIFGTWGGFLTYAFCPVNGLRTGTPGCTVLTSANRSNVSTDISMAFAPSPVLLNDGTIYLFGNTDDVSPYTHAHWWLLSVVKGGGSQGFKYLTDWASSDLANSILRITQGSYPFETLVSGCFFTPFAFLSEDPADPSQPSTSPKVERIHLFAGMNGSEGSAALVHIWQDVSSLQSVPEGSRTIWNYEFFDRPTPDGQQAGADTFPDRLAAVPVAVMGRAPGQFDLVGIGNQKMSPTRWVASISSSHGNVRLSPSEPFPQPAPDVRQTDVISLGGASWSNRFPAVATDEDSNSLSIEYFYQKSDHTLGHSYATYAKSVPSSVLDSETGFPVDQTLSSIKLLEPDGEQPAVALSPGGGPIHVFVPDVSGRLIHYRGNQRGFRDQQPPEALPEPIFNGPGMTPAAVFIPN